MTDYAAIVADLRDRAMWLADYRLGQNFRDVVDLLEAWAPVVDALRGSSRGDIGGTAYAALTVEQRTAAHELSKP